MSGSDDQSCPEFGRVAHVTSIQKHRSAIGIHRYLDFRGYRRHYVARVLDPLLKLDG